MKQEESESPPKQLDATIAVGQTYATSFARLIPGGSRTPMCRSAWFGLAGDMAPYAAIGAVTASYWVVAKED